MKKVLLVEYLGYCDRTNKPIGHPIKILEEYIYLLKDICEISLAAPKNIISNTSLKNIKQYYELPYFFCIDDDICIDKKKIRKNIEAAIRIKDYDYIWFINVTPVLFKVLILHSALLKKAICTIYQQKFRSKITNLYFKYCKNKIHLLIFTLNVGGGV